MHSFRPWKATISGAKFNSLDVMDSSTCRVADSGLGYYAREVGAGGGVYNH